MTIAVACVLAIACCTFRKLPTYDDDITNENENCRCPFFNAIIFAPTMNTFVNNHAHTAEREKNISQESWTHPYVRVDSEL
jgi:hypothetical protein